jgi:hypothetical protein
MDVQKVNSAAARLESWSRTLLNHLTSDQSNYSGVARTLNGREPLGSAPSKESLALLCLSEVRQDIDEIQAAYHDLYVAIRD